MYQEIRSILDHNQRTEFKRILLNLCNKYKSSYFHLRKHDVTGLSKEEKLALDSLRKDKSIIVSKPDKDQGVANLNKCDYIAKMESIFKIKRFSNQLNLMINIRKLSKFQGFLYRLKASKQLDDELYHLIRPTAASTPMLYGLPKLHKDGIPLRPILASTGSFNYQSAVWLNKILMPLREHDSNIKDTFDFQEKLSNMVNLSSKILASFDVKSLLTNIPVDFTIQIILQKLFPDKSTRFYGMNKRQFKKLLNWTCKTAPLQFDGKFYHQIDGMAMGSPLAPAMADIFMNWLVETVSTKFNHQFTVHRYVDNLFLTFDDPNHIDHVFSTFNSIHQKIKFTKENEENNKLAILDVQITKNSDCIETSIFRKNTNLGIYTRWDSYVPNRYKQNLVWALLHRAYSICNRAQLRKKEFQKVSNLLEKNGFSSNYINRQI